MKEIFPGLIGNERLKAALSGVLSHAYIIEGKPGSGRMCATKNCAAGILCESRDEPDGAMPCGKCSVCSRIARDIHPDFMVFSKGSKASIGVDVAREIRSQVFVAPVESEYKFFVIRDADLMTPEAQNALLISIEEPPPFSVFFLLVTDKALLLETIRSRCVTLTTEKLDDDTVAEYLRTLPEGERLYSSSPEKFSDAVKAADGAIGAGINIILGDAGDSKEVCDLAAELVRTVLLGSGGDKVRLAVSFPKTRDMLDKVYTMAVSAIRDIIAWKTKSGAPLLFYPDASQLSEFSAIPLRRLMKFYSAIEDARASFNVNPSTALTAESIIMIKL